MSDSITLEIQSKIIKMPGRPVAMLDRDLAEIYGTETKRINEAVRRNPNRFPEDFVYQFTIEETRNLWSQNATFEWLQHVKYTPHAFSREGANMLSAVLKTEVAAERSVQIMRAFSALEEKASGGCRNIGLRDVLVDIFRRLAILEAQFAPDQPKIPAGKVKQAAKMYRQYVSIAKNSGLGQSDANAKADEAVRAALGYSPLDLLGIGELDQTGSRSLPLPVDGAEDLDY